MTPTQDDTALIAGTVTKGTFQIVERLASSELSVVYLGSHATNGNLLIIKEFYPKALALRDTDGRTVVCRKPSNIGRFSELMEAFAREADLLRQLSHEHIVDYIDHFEENGTRYLVTGFCPGVTLDCYIREGRPASLSGLLKNTLLPLVDTLGYIHSKGMLHRDCKPSNIIIAEDGKPKLLDFGSAVGCGELNEHPIFTTKGFSPLELYSEKSRQGKVSDLFSVSAVIYFCLTGTIPVDVSQRLFKDSLPEVRAVNKEIGFVLSHMIKWGLAVQRQKRCPSLWLLKAALYLEYVRSKRKETQKNPTPL
ncbi:serine/threonine protein kinase [Paenibacillus rigui]|uniref:Serine/threonine protein kinase n=1 Tax=Paenibacillus rigui TaxID=554312 RepID=A0A229UPP3_9BACL|nr:serine/threonine-protein kinase [Paenibacillus rigui]OXM85392.1 serine/threonine protein kinase [Paenibacillus rigui]